jgi:hypothetical protein
MMKMANMIAAAVSTALCCANVSADGNQLPQHQNSGAPIVGEAESVAMSNDWLTAAGRLALHAGAHSGVHVDPTNGTQYIIDSAQYSTVMKTGQTIRVRQGSAVFLFDVVSVCPSNVVIRRNDVFPVAR